MSRASGRSLAVGYPIDWSQFGAGLIRPRRLDRWNDERAKKGELTGLGHTDANVTSAQLGSVEGERLLEAIQGGELDIAETLGLSLEPVLHDPDAGDGAVGKEVRDVRLSHLEGEVPNMGRVRWFVR